jgi:hypothetical protein
MQANILRQLAYHAYGVQRKPEPSSRSPFVRNNTDQKWTPSDKQQLKTTLQNFR